MMNREELLYIIEDYCSKYGIEITDEQMNETADRLADDVEAWEEYNARCGIHSVDVDILLDSYDLE